MRFKGFNARRFAVLFMVLAACISTVAIAQDRPLPLVTVTRTDGSSLRGRLTASDPKAITVTPIARPKTRTEPEQLGEAVQLAWGEIKSISSGLTRQRVIEQWKKEHPEDHCETCRASGRSECAACKGSGRDAAAAGDCPTCKGAQTVACDTPRCDGGMIPCPRPCLKPTDAGWVKRDDGRRWRRIPAPGGGTIEVSDGHLGEIIEIRNGQPQPPFKCPTCKGQMKVQCPKCHGDGQAPCAACTAAARTRPCPSCQRGQVACQTCTGLGLKPEVLGP